MDAVEVLFLVGMFVVSVIFGLYVARVAALERRQDAQIDTKEMNDD